MEQLASCFPVLLESIMDGLFILDRDWRIAFVNSYAERFASRNRSELLGRSMWEIFPEARFMRFYEEYCRALRENVSVRFEESYPPLNKWVEVHAWPVDGYLFICFQDVTERKLTEEAMLESQRRFRSLFEYAAIGLVITDLDGRFLEVNEQYCRFLGYTEQELLARRVMDVTHPDDLAETVAGFEAVRGGKLRRFDLEKRYLRKDGQVMYANTVANWIIGPGERDTYCVAQVKDITRWKEAERRLSETNDTLRTLLTSSPIPIISLDREGRTTLWNPAAERVFGYTAEEVLGHSVPIVSPQARQRLHANLVRVLDGETLYGSEEERIRKDGSVVYVSLSAGAVRDHEGRAVGSIATLTDITERKQAEEELRQSREQLRQLAASLQVAREQERTLIAREVHDHLGQVLTRLKIEMTRIHRHLDRREDPLAENSREMLDLVGSTIESVQRISSFLRPGVLDQLGLIAALEWLVKDFAQHTGIEASFRCGGSVSEPPPEKATALFRIVQEALTNVARHAEAESVVVRLFRRKGSVFLLIRDNGRGITPEQISAPASLGLLGMRERARMFDADLMIQGHAGKGTRVTLVMPEAPSRPAGESA